MSMAKVLVKVISNVAEVTLLELQRFEENKDVICAKKCVNCDRILDVTRRHIYIEEHNCNWLRGIR